MLQLQVYNTLGAFLSATSVFLEAQELDNNLLLGLVAALDPQTTYPDFHFLSVTDYAGTVFAASILMGHKPIVSANAEDTEAIQCLVDYYRKETIKLPGVFAESATASVFATLAGCRVKETKDMLVHQLEQVQPVSLSAGSMSLVTLSELSIITAYLRAFDTEIFGSSNKTEAALIKETEDRIRRDLVYTWKDENDVIVSMAVVVRRTRHIAIIGYVYTPPELRGKGYAGSLVWTLSNTLLQSYKSCGLFTEKANPVSNSIYRKIGYVSGSMFSDIYFE